MPAAARARFVCSACGAVAPRWQGRCDGCGGWNTVAEESSSALAVRSARRVGPVAPVRRLRELSTQPVHRRSSGVGEFDRVLGGGLVAGQAVLLAGEPGVGKSTLLLTVADRVAADGATVLYVSAEESAEQVAIRGRRIGATAAGVLIAEESEVGAVLALVAEHRPALVVVDSVQTVSAGDVEGRAGGVAQVLEVTQRLVRAAKASDTPLIVVGQSTKDSAVAGPRALEHLVDTVLLFEGDRQSSLRLCRTAKNRYGPADEVACFEQVENGLAEVADPSTLFRDRRDSPVPGTCVCVTLEGRRALLAEVQALVGHALQGGMPRRGVSGLDGNRVAMLLAVTERTATDLSISARDVYVATVAGARITDPAADLAICLAVVSAHLEAPMPEDVLAIGEVALSGDIRPVLGIAPRVAEAVRVGYRRILVPRGAAGRIGAVPAGVAVIEVEHLRAAVTALERIAHAPQAGARQAG